MSQIKLAISHLVNADRKLLPLIDRYGKDIKSQKRPGFESLARTIVGQQLSGAAARTIFKRLCDVVKVEQLTPQALLAAAPERIRTAGISGSKVRFIRGLAEKSLAEPEFYNRLTKLSDEDAFDSLCTINGVGPWSAGIYLMFSEGRQNIFPHGDGSLHRAIKKLYRVEPDLKNPRFRRVVSRWSPYRTAACRLLWNWVDDGFPRLAL